MRRRTVPIWILSAFLALCLWGEALAAASRPPEAAATPATAAPPIAIAVDTRAVDARTEIRLTLSRSVAASAFVLEKPDRVVVDMPETSFQLPPDSGRARAGLVSAMRFGLVAPGRSRVVIDLSAPAAPTRTAIEYGADRLPQLVIDLSRIDRDTFRRMATGAVRGSAIVTTGSVPTTAEAGDRRPILVLDAGHGGIDPGATAPTGEQEKEIVLAFVETLRDILAAGGRYRLVLSRDSDVFVPLDERVRRARAAGAELFISIHADTIASAAVSGATIYTGAERATDGESATLADRENQADAAAGYAARDRGSDVSDILADLTQRETRGFSRRFASQLHGELDGAVRFSSHPQREAGFRVLRSGDIPAVLVELGYLSNARDVAHLTSDDWRRQAAGAMAGAVHRFFADRTVGRNTAAVSP